MPTKPRGTRRSASQTLTLVWVRLDALFVRLPEVPTHVIDTGLDLTGEVPGRLHGWFRRSRTTGSVIVDYEVSYADGRREHVQLVNQLVPAYAVRPTEKANAGLRHPRLTITVGHSVALAQISNKDGD